MLHGDLVFDVACVKALSEVSWESVDPTLSVPQKGFSPEVVNCELLNIDVGIEGTSYMAFQAMCHLMAETIGI